MGFRKCNVDGTVPRTGSEASYSENIRDSIDNVLVAFSGRLKGCHVADVAELQGCLRALEYIHADVQGSGTVEIDTQKVHNVLTAREEDDSECCFIIADCRALLRLRTDVSLKWVRRQCDTVVHEIDRAARLYPSSHYFSN